ncbi:MAG: hypothetical protein WCE65_02770 [Methanoregula sp.]
MSQDNISRLAIRCILCHIFEIEPIQVSETAVPASYCDSTATDGDIMRPVNPTVSAHCRCR